MGSGGAVGLNFLAVERIALLAEVPADEILHFFMMVDRLAKQVINFQLEEIKAEEARNKKNK